MNSFLRAFWLSYVCRRSWLAVIAVLLYAGVCRSQAVAPAPSGPDTLVLSNGDTLHGKMVSELGGKVTFHTDDLGDVAVPFSHIKELHTEQKFAVLDKTVKIGGRKQAGRIPVGTLDVQNQAVQVHTEKALAPIPVGDAAYIVDQATLNQEVNHEPGFFGGWDGAVTGGGTLVEATQNQYTASGSVGLVRAVPNVDWLNPRNRTSADFSGSFGKITQRGTPAVKSALFHADAERDEYFSPRVFALGQVAFDHNYSQELALQSVYGGGLGYKVFARPVQQLSAKATIQYETQQFLTTTGSTTTSPTLNLIGSTVALNYAAKLKLFTFTQEASFVPAFNVSRAYSANEADTMVFPAYKSFSLSVGTLDSYLNDPPTSVPPTKHNSFQFTVGLTYGFKSKY